MGFHFNKLIIKDYGSNTRVFLGKLLIGIITCSNNKYYMDSLDINSPSSFESEDACIEYLINLLN